MLASCEHARCSKTRWLAAYGCPRLPLRLWLPTSTRSVQRHVAVRMRVDPRTAVGVSSPEERRYEASVGYRCPLLSCEHRGDQLAPACYIAVTLPLHCRYSAVTVPLQCRYIAVIVPLHCRYSAVTLPLHCCHLPAPCSQVNGGCARELVVLADVRSFPVSSTH